MKKQEIKKLSKDEVLKNIDKLKKDLFNLSIFFKTSSLDKLKKDLFNFRFQKINSQITDPSKIGNTKKTIARLKTLLKGKLNA